MELDVLPEMYCFMIRLIPLMGPGVKTLFENKRRKAKRSPELNSSNIITSSFKTGVK